jgi:hypothetical protein
LCLGATGNKDNHLHGGSSCFSFIVGLRQQGRVESLRLGIDSLAMPWCDLDGVKEDSWKHLSFPSSRGMIVLVFHYH